MGSLELFSTYVFVFICFNAIAKLHAMDEKYFMVLSLENESGILI